MEGKFKDLEEPKNSIEMMHKGFSTSRYFMSVENF